MISAVEAALAQRERAPGPATAVPLRTIGAGLAELPTDGSAPAIVSVPGQYAAAEAADAVTAGRSVLVFSDGVPAPAIRPGRRCGAFPEADQRPLATRF